MKRIALAVSGSLSIALAVGCSGGSGSGGGSTPTPTPTGSPTPSVYTWTDPGFSEPAHTENYECFYVDVPTGTGVGATKFAYSSTTNILHHVVVFTTTDTSQANGSYSDCSTEAFNPNWTVRYAGGVGSGTMTLPPGVAMAMSGPTQRFVFQLHLLNASLNPVTDDTQIQITFTPPNATFTHAGLMVSGSTNFSLSPNTTTVATAHCMIPGAVPTVHFMSIWPHMHKLGTEFKIDYLPGGGSPTTILDWAWNFNSQPMYVVTNGMTVSGGDEIDTTCTWNNITNSTVTYGPSSNDEMCFDFFYYYPAVSETELYCSDAIP